ncbi:MAG: tautomerase family protein [Casimicrobiaceae bacterium]
MPRITVQLLTGRTVEQKSELVAALTRETSQICGCSTDAVSIVIEDVDKDNWGIGGVLASEKFPGPPSALGSGDPRYRKE